MNQEHIRDIAKRSADILKDTKISEDEQNRLIGKEVVGFTDDEYSYYAAQLFVFLRMQYLKTKEKKVSHDTV